MKPDLPEELSPRTLILVGGLLLLVFPVGFVLASAVLAPLAGAISPAYADPIAAALGAALAMATCFFLFSWLNRS